jgi:hypothetical protein
MPSMSAQGRQEKPIKINDIKSTKKSQSNLTQALRFFLSKMAKQVTILT